jgi:hypothetical protein
MFWQEGPAVERTVVHGNDIHDGNLLGRVPAAVWIGAFVAPGGHQGIETAEVVNRTVGIGDNQFIRPNGAAVAVGSTRDLRIEDNRIEQASAVAFSLDNVRNARLTGNRCAPAATIKVDALSRGNVKLGSNVGLRMT